MIGGGLTVAFAVRPFIGDAGLRSEPSAAQAGSVVRAISSVGAAVGAMLVLFLFSEAIAAFPGLGGEPPEIEPLELVVSVPLVSLALLVSAYLGRWLIDTAAQVRALEGLQQTLRAELTDARTDPAVVAGLMLVAPQSLPAGSVPQLGRRAMVLLRLLLIPVAAAAAAVGIITAAAAMRLDVGLLALAGFAMSLVVIIPVQALRGTLVGRLERAGGTLLLFLAACVILMLAAEMALELLARAPGGLIAWPVPVAVASPLVLAFWPRSLPTLWGPARTQFSSASVWLSDDPVRGLRATRKVRADVLPRARRWCPGGFFIAGAFRVWRVVYLSDRLIIIESDLAALRADIHLAGTAATAGRL